MNICQTAGLTMFAASVNRRDELREARNVLRTIGVRSLLADPTDNPKLAKNIGMRALTAPLHLAPHKLSGFNVCPMATRGCIAACLHTAGNPAYMAGKFKARIARTKAFFANRAAFMLCLVAEIEKHQRTAKAQGMLCGVRLNATSDIRWETIGCTKDGKAFDNIMTAFPNIQFYDYTKIANRRNLPKNYHLTFSLAENNEHNAIDAINAGMNVAAVFNVGRHKALPEFHSLDGVELPVIDGDEHDFRPIDPKRCIVGLRAKGKAIGDLSGFVREVA